MKANKLSAKDAAYDYIKQRIITGEYQPKEKIDDVLIAKELGISKMPIREAIQVLVTQNFLRSTPKIGTTVTEINIEDVYRLYEPLALIQGLAAKNACLSIKKENIEELEQINDQIKIAADQNDFISIMHLDKEFHNYIVALADNPYIKNFCDDLLMQVQRIDFLILNSSISFPNSYEYHLDIIQAFKDKDDKRAGKLTEENWLNTIPDVNVKSLSRLVHALK